MIDIVLCNMCLGSWGRWPRLP